jgi:tRNA A37 methylthiotransferase MiaB
MNRNYNIQELINILNEIKNNSNTKLMNHIIFDYHDETLEEFVGTFKLLKYYDKNFYFRYSDVNNIY